MNTNKTAIDMRLVSLELKNFKGIRSFKFEPNASNVSIYGANEAGKTTINDALTWLLFGKDTLDRSPDSFGIKTLVNGETMRDVEHAVIGEFRNVVLKKVYKEKWVTKRGNSESEMQGHTTYYFIDDVPKSEKEYKEFIDSIIDEQVIKMLTIPNFFAEILPWKERRDILLELCGDIDTDAIIEANAELANYPALLDGKTEDDRKAILTASKRRLNEELKNIPARLDELNMLIKDEGNADEAKANLETFTKNKEGIQNKIHSLKSGGVAASINNAISALKGELIEVRSGFTEQVANALSGAKKAVRDAEEKVNTEVHAINMKVAEAKSRKQTKIGEYNSFKAVIEGLLTTINTAKSDQDKVRASEPKPDTGGGVCPMCEQPIAEDHSYQDYLEEFNAEKAKNIKEYDEIVLTLTAELDAESSKLEQIKSEGKAIEAEIQALEVAKLTIASNTQKVVDEAKAKLQALEAEQPKLEDDERYISFNSQIAEHEEKLQNLESETADQVAALTAKVAEINEGIEECNNVINTYKNNANYAKRIAELTTERTKYADELEEVDAGLFLIESFVRARSAYVSEKVNSMFNGVKWVLFKDQVNGGVTEICEATGKNGVPFTAGMNNAQRVQVGIEIIKTLSAFYGVSLPVFVDNREGVTNLPESDLQVISLVVSPQDKELRVEIEETVNAFA